MSKKARTDELGDSDELQALFDSIAGHDAPEAAAVPEAPLAAAAGSDEGGDSDSLQALFDEVSASREPVAGQEPLTAEEDSVFRRLGKMTRQLHDALHALGLEEGLKEAARSMPDTRQRLDYIAQLTEQAASRVLNATDIAKPLQDELQTGAAQLQERWEAAFDGKLTTEAFRSLSLETKEFLGQVESSAASSGAQLMEIMLAQDFQDLTGQVIKRTLGTARQLEAQLLQLLLETAPPELVSEHKTGLMNGPVTAADAGDEVVSSQEQVDDLLESLGF